MRGGFKRLHRDAFGIAARLAVRVYSCEQCGTWGGSVKPAQCKRCGSMAFIKFDSKTEAERWATLNLLQAQGMISKLERQVRFPLFAYRDFDARVVAIGHYVADFVYQEDGARVIEDMKGGAITDLAAWKIKHMAAQGQPVKVVKA